MADSLPLPTKDQKSQIKYFDNQSEASGVFIDPKTGRRGKIKFAHTRLWRGSHQKCSRGHSDGLCVAGNAWKVVAGTWKIEADVAIVNLEEGSMAMHKQEGVVGAFPEPWFHAKGWRQLDEIRPDVRPSAEVVDRIIELQVTMRKQELTMGKTPSAPDVVERECEKRRKELTDANVAPAAKPERSK